MIDHQRRYTVTIKQGVDGSVLVRLCVAPAFEEGMSVETLAVRRFLSQDAADWTDVETATAAIAWGQKALPEALLAYGSDETRAAAVTAQLSMEAL